MLSRYHAHCERFARLVRPSLGEKGMKPRLYRRGFPARSSSSILVRPILKALIGSYALEIVYASS
jgi:hypothetical protein